MYLFITESYETSTKISITTEKHLPCRNRIHGWKVQNVKKRYMYINCVAFPFLFHNHTKSQYLQHILNYYSHLKNSVRSLLKKKWNSAVPLSMIKNFAVHYRRKGYFLVPLMTRKEFATYKLHLIKLIFFLCVCVCVLFINEF